MSQYACYAPFKLCVIRAARLGSNCKVVPGATGGFASSGLMSMNITTEKESGQEYTMKNGCGDILHYLRDQDRVKNINVTLEMTGYDFEALELLTDGTLIMDNAGTPKVSGISDPGINATRGYGAYLEVWEKTINGSSDCSPDTGEGFGWFRTVLPRVFLSRDDTEYGNDIHTVKLSGYGFANPGITSSGPFNDYPITGHLDHTSPRHIFGDVTGPPSTSCGYITVPAQTGSSY